MQVVVVGAGPVGLFCGMGLARQGHEVVVVERDGPPPPVPAEWDRRGVMQFLGPHMFRFIVRQKLLEVLPDVWEALVAAGAVPVRPDGSPEEMTSLQSRRSTVEAAWWSSAANEPGLTMRRGTAQSIGARGGRVSGIVVDGELIEADVVILATGRITRLGDQYRARGEGGSSGFSYTARMYRARDSVDPPFGARPIVALYEGYGAAIFPQDDRTFTALFHRPTADTGLAGLRRVDAFEAAARQVPLLAPWIDPDRFVPITSVLAGSGLSNTYQSGLDDNGKAALAGLFFVGDALSTTNPSLGRGISLGLRQAAELMDSLPETEGTFAVQQSSSIHGAPSTSDPGTRITCTPTSPSWRGSEARRSISMPRTSWRPPYANGPSAPALAEVVSSSSRSTRTKS